MLDNEHIDQIRAAVREEANKAFERHYRSLKEEIKRMTQVAEELTAAVASLEDEDSALAAAVAAIAPEFTVLDEDIETLNTKITEAGDAGEVTLTKAEAEQLVGRVGAVGTKIGEAASTVTEAVAAAKAGNNGEPAGA